MSEAVIRSYLKGRTFPTLDRLYILAEACNCSVEWLATGKGCTENDSFKYAKVESASIDNTEENLELKMVLKRLSTRECEALFDIIFRNGVGAVLSLSDEQNIKLLQLPQTVKSGVLRLASGSDTAIREILSKLESNNPPTSVADKKAV